MEGRIKRVNCCRIQFLAPRPIASFTLGLQSGDDSTIAQATRPDTSDDGFSETVIPRSSRYLCHPLTRFDGRTPRSLL